jgi:general secretion pathway protein G
MRTRRGFSLIEIMVVVTIIGMLIGLVAFRFGGTQFAASRKVTLAKMARIRQALDLYKLDTRKYPAAGDGLKALTVPPPNRSQGYLEDADLVDAWNSRIQYAVPGKSGKHYDLISYGDDGAPGGDKENADFSCWDADEKPAAP